MSPRCPRFDRGRRSSDGGCVERGKDLIVARAPGVVNNRRQPAEGRSAREHPQRRHGSVLEQHLSEDLGVGWLNGRAGALGVLDEAVDGVEGDGYARSAGGRQFLVGGRSCRGLPQHAPVCHIQPARHRRRRHRHAELIGRRLEGGVRKPACGHWRSRQPLPGKEPWRCRMLAWRNCPRHGPERLDHIGARHWRRLRRRRRARDN
mmetsp:Transcript_22451/g.72569  ORF Transcript_22451/g.72569 Transcript_22451/m.72569 type:complete len:205 (-) Transcript_22451:288-902(-)